MADYAYTLESFPFDSDPDVTFDEDGYPIYDRAVGAKVMRTVFEKFFSDGVFPSPAGELEVDAGESGLTVKVGAGVGIIKGAWGVLSSPITLTLDEQVQGNTCYGIMLAYDENTEQRSISFRVAKGTPGATPQPPEPDRTTPGIYEYRIADVTLNSGATSVSASNVKNNKGTETWPYAAPFVDLDVGAIVHDAQAEAEEIVESLNDSANTSLENVQKFIADNMALVESALDGTTAGHLQNQIDELSESAINENSLNGRYFEFSSDTPEAPKKLSMKESSIGESELQTGSVTTEKINDGSVTMEKISQEVVDTSGGLASSDALFRTTNDVFELAYKLHLSDLESLDVDTIFEWSFEADATLNSGKWSGSYYYADKGTGN